MTLIEKYGVVYVFRRLEQSDEDLLATYFLSLSQETRSRFGPHPLTADYAAELCHRQQDSAQRFILLAACQDKLLGYFIVEYEISTDEIRRYETYGIQLDPGLDPLFAPSITDDYQNKGLASLVMPLIIEDARNRGSRRLVLMGGTQERNKRAIAFYKKFGFKTHGQFQTEISNYDMSLIL